MRNASAQGDFVCEYSGDLITNAEAQIREAAYIAEDFANGVVEPMCYMYFLSHAGRKWWYVTVQPQSLSLHGGFSYK